MQRAVISGEREASIVEADEPEAFEDWAKIKVHAAPMCTEHKAFSDGDERSFLGHEAAGEVVDVAQSGRFEVGDRVVTFPLYSCGDCWLCRSGELLYCEDKLDLAEETGSREGEATYAQYHLKPDWLLAELPDDVSYLHGSMACCGLGPTFGAMERMGVDAFDTVLVSEVLEHVPVPVLPEFVAEIRRVLKPGGASLASTPFVYPNHGATDKSRLTRESTGELFESEGFDVTVYAGGGYTEVLLHVLSRPVLGLLRKVDRRLGWPFALVHYVSFLLATLAHRAAVVTAGRNPRANLWYLNTFTVTRKPATDGES